MIKAKDEELKTLATENRKELEAKDSEIAQRDKTIKTKDANITQLREEAMEKAFF